MQHFPPIWMVELRRPYLLFPPSSWSDDYWIFRDFLERTNISLVFWVYWKWAYAVGWPLILRKASIDKMQAATIVRSGSITTADERQLRVESSRSRQTTFDPLRTVAMGCFRPKADRPIRLESQRWFTSLQDWARLCLWRWRFPFVHKDRKRSSQHINKSIPRQCQPCQLLSILNTHLSIFLVKT